MVFTDDSVLHSQWPSENTKASLDHRPWLPNSAGVGVSLSDHPGSGRFTEATPKDMQMPGVEYELQRHAMRCPRGACRIQPGRTSSMQSQKVSRGLWKILQMYCRRMLKRSWAPCIKQIPRCILQSRRLLSSGAVGRRMKHPPDDSKHTPMSENLCLPICSMVLQYLPTFTPIVPKL